MPPNTKWPAIMLASKRKPSTTHRMSIPTSSKTNTMGLINTPINPGMSMCGM